MNRPKKVVIVLFLIGVSLFGYSQYAFASQIEVIITESKLLEENNDSSLYNIQLQFDNPSLLILTSGETEFLVSGDGQTLGDGRLPPFTLPALGTTTVDGTFRMDSKLNSESDSSSVRISGVTKYNVIFTSIDVPFVFHPSEEQAREFIHQK